MDESLANDPVTTLTSLVGTWHGGGTVWLPSMAPREYEEEIRFSVRSPSSLDYWQRATDPADGAMLHSESGIWRVTAAGSLELSVALPSATEVSEGTIETGAISLASIAIGLAAGGARLVATTRRYTLGPDAVAYEIEIATEAFPLAGHLHGEVRRTRQGG